MASAAILKVLFLLSLCILAIGKCIETDSRHSDDAMIKDGDQPWSSPSKRAAEKVPCQPLPRAVLEKIMGAAFNPRYMSIEKPDAEDAVSDVLPSGQKDQGYWRKKRPPVEAFHVHQGFARILHEEPIADYYTNHVSNVEDDEVIGKDQQYRGIKEFDDRPEFAVTEKPPMGSIGATGGHRKRHPHSRTEQDERSGGQSKTNGQSGHGDQSGQKGPSGHGDQSRQKGPSGQKDPSGHGDRSGQKGPSGHGDQSGQKDPSGQKGPSGHGDPSGQKGPSGHGDQSGQKGPSGYRDQSGQHGQLASLEKFKMDHFEQGEPPVEPSMESKSISRLGQQTEPSASEKFVKSVTKRSKRTVKNGFPWACESRIEWLDLGANHFPRFLRSVVCTNEKCWFGHFQCRPKAFTVKVLRRRKDSCSPEKVKRESKEDTEEGIRDENSFVPKEFREQWVFEERAVTFCCECAG